MITTLLTAARLCGALVTLHGAEVPHHRLCRAAIIIAHVADEWPPELLASIAWRESRFDASAVNPAHRLLGRAPSLYASPRPVRVGRVRRRRHQAARGAAVLCAAIRRPAVRPRGVRERASRCAWALVPRAAACRARGRAGACGDGLARAGRKG
jgi:hypothetical protein